MDVRVDLIEFLDDLRVNRAEDLAVGVGDREFNLFFGCEALCRKRRAEGECAEKLGELASRKLNGHLKYLA